MMTATQKFGILYLKIHRTAMLASAPEVCHSTGVHLGWGAYAPPQAMATKREIQG
jgi:hypothetical protein